MQLRDTCRDFNSMGVVGADTSEQDREVKLGAVGEVPCIKQLIFTEWFMMGGERLTTIRILNGGPVAVRRH